MITRNVGFCLAAAFVAWAPSARVRAGDRGLYLAFVDARGNGVDDARRDGLERALFECGEMTLSACRMQYRTGSDRDTDMHPVYAVQAADVDTAMAVDATRSARGQRVLLRSLNERDVAIDGIIVYLVDARGRATCVCVNLTRRRAMRVAVPSSGTLSETQMRRVLRHLSFGWVP